MDGKKYGFVLGQEKKPGIFPFTFWQINWGDHLSSLFILKIHVFTG